MSQDLTHIPKKEKYLFFFSVFMMFGNILLFYLKNYHPIIEKSLPFTQVLCLIFLFLLFRLRIHFGKILLTDLLRSKRLEAKAWYFDNIISNSGNIIFTTDHEHRIMKFNHGSERTFGLNQTEVLGREVQGLFQDSEQILELLIKVKNEGWAETEELKIISPISAEEVWMSVHITRMLGRGGESIGEVFNCNNITTRKQLELTLQEKNEQLTRLSITDALTGLYNMRHLRTELSRFLKSQIRYPNRSLSIAIIDIDRFKTFNDARGHQEGDKLLNALGYVLINTIRKDLDSAFRYGGDEFTIILPDTTFEGALVICQRILTAYRKLAFTPTTLSIGIAQFQDISKENNLPESPRIDQLMTQFIAKADSAMYEIKGHGGDGIQLYGKALSPEVAERKQASAGR